MQTKGLLQQRMRMLHIAPELCLENKLKKIENVDYTRIDLYAENVDVRCSLTHLSFCSDVFDLIYCSNVLEHINEDRLAISELFRVTKRGGLAIIQVPVEGERTFEDATVTCPIERDRLFGQWDHVRLYGRDVKQRLERAGFSVQECVTPDSLGLSDEQIKLYGIAERQLVHICYKRQRV
jgi:SAM-dependent methyltransferase